MAPLAAALLPALLLMAFTPPPGARDSYRAPQPGALDAYAVPARRVALPGGRQLNLVCRGARGANPVIILDAGFQAWSFAWNKVQPRLAASTRVCGYDRAGLGFSDPGPLPRDGVAIAADLAALLAAAGERPPYIVVGHSAGGLYVREFARRNLRDVVGMVLVDPAADTQFIGQEDRIAATAARFAGCALAAAEQRLPAPDLPQCNTAATDTAFDDSVRLLARTPGYWATLASEMGALPATAAALAGVSLGDMPLIVLSAGGKGDDSAEAAASRAVRIAAHAGLAALSTRGRSIIVADSSHLMMRDRPQAVIDAVADVAKAARAR
ncbi:MAG: alpha/beta fold hydrolase [Polymorphobacter sp.]